MKKILFFLILIYFGNFNYVYPDDLKGKKIFCQIDKTPVLGSVNPLNKYISFEFKRFSKVRVIQLNPYIGEYLGKESYTKTTHNYVTTPTRIYIKKYKDWGDLTIRRQNLELTTWGNYVCEIVSKENNLDKKMDILYKDLLKKVKDKNKI